MAINTSIIATNHFNPTFDDTGTPPSYGFIATATGNVAVLLSGNSELTLTLAVTAGESYLRGSEIKRYLSLGTDIANTAIIALG